MSGLEPASPRCKRGALPVELHPQRCGRVDSNDHSQGQRGYSPTSSPSAQRPQGVTGRPRTGACGVHNPGCFRLHHGHRESEAGTTGLEPAASRLTSERSLASELRPREKRWKAGSAPRNRRQRRCRRSRPRSQLLPISAPASACPRRHLLTGRPWRLVEASCRLGPALCTSPCSVTSLTRPSTDQS